MSNAEFESHIIGKWSVSTPFGFAHYTDLDKFDPQLFLENTPVGNATDKYQTRAFVGGITVIYSHEKVNEGIELLMLSVSGGEEQTQGDVIKQFGEYLGANTHRFDWVRVSPLGTSPQRNMYIWRVNLGSKL